jgi:hypothetical protein
VEEQATLFRVLRNIFGWLFDEFARRSHVKRGGGDLMPHVSSR